MCEKLDFYLICSQFQIETDHKPLVKLLGNSDLGSMPLRCQRFRLRLSRNQFDILFTPGNQMYLSDLLSRAAREPNKEETMVGQRIEIYVSTIVAADDMYKAGTLEKLKKDSSKDNNYLHVLEEKRGGWAKKLKSYKGYLRRLYTQRENVMVKDNLLMCGNRVVIPNNMKTK